LPETDLARIHRWVQKENEKIPPHARTDVRIELDVDARSVTILNAEEDVGLQRAGVLAANNL
jgi:hypothetical protein